MDATTERETLRRVEPIAALVLVLLKLHVLHDAWGVLQGFDPVSWLDVFQVSHWFEPLPSPRAFYTSYHPPLSYLLTRIVFWFHAHEIEACQIVSTLAMLGGFFALRSALRHIGWLWTPAGLWLLYGGSSIPLLVWLAVETGCYDGLLFMWFTAALAVSIHLFWQPRERRLWRDARAMVLTTLLGLVMAAGLLTKFTELIAFGLPFLIVVVRRGPRALVREAAAPIAAILIAVIVVAPFYYGHYWVSEKRLMPGGMDWQSPGGDMQERHAMRDRARLRFLGNLLRYPEQPIVGNHEPQMDSFNHSIWLHTWKRDTTLGPQPELSSKVSDFYVRVFAVVLLAGTVLMILRRRKIPEDWRHMGWILLALAAVFCLSAIAFAWRYPAFEWRIFKGKYIAPAMLWIGYAAGLALLGAWFPSADSPWRRRISKAALIALVLFVCANHLIPVY